MKKLFPVLLCFLSASAFAQSSVQSNSLAVLGGPNWFQQYRDRPSNNVRYKSETGFSVGVEYAQAFAPHWQWTAGLRYNELKFSTVLTNVQWPSENQNGQYVFDPTLPHTITLENQTDRAWQLLGGLRWHSGPRSWRFYGDLQGGFTDHATDGSSDLHLRPTVSLGLCLEWRPNRFGIFVQPAAQYIFRSLGGDVNGYTFLVPSVVAGGRFYF